MSFVGVEVGYARIPAWVHDVDRALASATRESPLLSAATPRGGATREELVSAFAAGDPKPPCWTYAPADRERAVALALALESLAKRLERRDPQALAKAYAARARELSIEVLLGAEAGAAAFASLARMRFPVGERGVASRLAEAWVAERNAPPEDDGASAAAAARSTPDGASAAAAARSTPDGASAAAAARSTPDGASAAAAARSTPDGASAARSAADEESDGDAPTSLLSRLKEEIGRLRLPFRVVVSRGLAPLAATGDRAIWVAGGRRISRADVERTVLHEIHGHALPRARASVLQPGLFAIGTARGVDEQEGLALVLEERGGFLVGARRRELALRHRAVEAMDAGGTFVDVVRALMDRDGADPARAVLAAERAFRGSRGETPGLGRERVYLEAYARVSAHLRERPADERVLAAGQVSVEAIGALRAFVR